MSVNFDTCNKIDQNSPSPVNDTKQSLMSPLKNKTNVQSVQANSLHSNL